MQDNYIEQAKSRYEAIRTPIQCRCLNQQVVFNSNGFNHLVFNGLGSRRTVAEIKHKLRLIALIVPVLLNATDVCYEKRMVKKSRKKNAPLVVAEFWGITANVGKNVVSVKVILKRVGNGNIHFWSVMREREKSKTKKHQST